MTTTYAYTLDVKGKDLITSDVQAVSEQDALSKIKAAHTPPKGATVHIALIASSKRTPAKHLI